MDAFGNYGMTGLDDFYLTDDHFADANMQELLQGVSAYQTAGQACGNNSNHYSTPGAHAPVTVPAQQAHIPDDSFWSTDSTMQLSNGMEISGSNDQLWTNFDELRPSLVKTRNAGQAPPCAEAFASPMSNPQYLAPAPANRELAYNSPYPSQAVMTPSPNCPTPNSTSTPSPTPVRRTISKTVSKRKRNTTPIQPANLAPYQPSLDLNSPAAAREYLSRFDPSEAQLLKIPFDDVPIVQANLHAYAARVHNALLAPYDSNINDDRETKYIEQQEATLTSLHKMLYTSAQQKAAKASAILLVDAAIAVHTSGVSAERYSKHNTAVTHNLKSDDAYKIATSLTCSARVDAMIDAVKANKLIAKDVLEGKNFLRFAECPESYLARKLQYLRSNKTRQDKVDERLAEEEMKRGKGKKRARRAYEEDDDDEFEL